MNFRTSPRTPSPAIHPPRAPPRPALYLCSHHWLPSDVHTCRRRRRAQRNWPRPADQRHGAPANPLLHPIGHKLRCNTTAAARPSCISPGINACALCNIRPAVGSPSTCSPALPRPPAPPTPPRPALPRPSILRRPGSALRQELIGEARRTPAQLELVMWLARASTAQLSLTLSPGR